VDLTTRYSNHPDELDQVRELLKRIAAGDRSGAPGLDGEPDQAPEAQPRRPRRLAERLQPDALPTMITQFLSGATVQALATEYGISRSSVKNILRRHGARRQSCPSAALAVPARSGGS
jgi:DNA invertase Pin-like site-specific DNA recombinase